MGHVKSDILAAASHCRVAERNDAGTWEDITLTNATGVDEDVTGNGADYKVVIIIAYRQRGETLNGRGCSAIVFIQIFWVVCYVQ